MTTTALGDDLAGIRDRLGQLASAGLDERDPPDGPADLELLALNLIEPFAHPELPVDAVSLLPESLANRGDELAAGILAALAALAPEPLSGLAVRAREQLAAGGVTSRFAERVGVLEARECYRVRLGAGEAEVLGVLLQRPGEARAQAAVLFVEHVPCGGVVVGGLLGGPEDPDAVRELLRRSRGAVGTVETISPGALARSVSAALGHMVDHVLELPVDVVHVLLVCERALTGQAGAWPRPLLRLPDGAGDVEDDIDDEARVQAEADLLVQAFAAHVAEQEGASRVAKHGPFVIATLLSWKIGYADGRIERWAVADLHEFLLDWYPRKGESEDEVVWAVPDCVTAFLRFLAETGRLSGEELETLTATVAQLSDRFVRAAGDPRNWGLAKSMVMRMRAEGVDPSEPGALEAWIENFNTRPHRERDRVFRSASDRMLTAARGELRTEDRRRARRRAQKAARKRNRR